MAAALLERVREIRSTKTAAAEDRFWALARESAGGSDIDPEDAIEALEAAGKSAEDLIAAADQIAARLRDSDAAKAVAAASAKRAAKQTELEKLVAEFEAHQGRVVAIENGIRSEMRRLDQTVTDGELADSRLLAECPYPGLKRRHAELTRAINHANSTSDDLRKFIGKRRGEIAARAAMPDASKIHPTLDRSHAILPQVRAQLDEAAAAEIARLEAELAPLVASLPKLEADLAALELEMRKP